MTVFCKLAIFWAVIGLSENSPSKLQNVTMIESIKKLGQHEDSENRLKIFCKLRIFWLVSGLSDIFTLRA